MKSLHFALCAIGGALCLDTLLLLPRSNWNLGVLLPFIYGLPLFLLGLFSSRLAPLWTSRFGMALRAVLLFGYTLSFVFFLVTSAFLYMQGKRDAPEAADALLVLGCGLRGDRPSLVLTYRLDAALAYLEANPGTLCFVSGGQGEGESIPEAHAMRAYLVSRGIPEERIVVEDKSMSTRENFAFSLPLITERLGKDAKIAYLTTRFHVYRAGRVAAAQNIEASGIGAGDVWYLCVNNYLRESVAVVIYALRGQI